jgi:O-antigen ligase
MVGLSSAMCIESLFLQPIIKSGWSFHSAFGSNYIAFARTTGYALIIIIGLIFSAKKFNPIIPIWICFFFLNLFGLFYSGSRAPVIAFITTVFFIWLYMLISSKLKIKMASVGVSLIIFTLSFIFFFDEYFYVLFTKMEELGSGELYNYSSRSKFYTQSINALNSSILSPFIGIGIGGFNYIAGFADTKEGVYPHNIFLEILCETGILGLAVFLFLLVNIYKRIDILIRSRSDLRPLVYTVSGLILYMLINSLFSADINGNRVLFASFGMLYAFNNINRQENP